MKKNNIFFIFKLIIIFYFLQYSILLWAQVIHVEKIFNLKPPINTQWDDFAPSFTGDGKIIVFNSKRANGRNQDIFISFFRNGKWSNPRALHQLNSRFNDETPYITPDASFIFFSSDRDGSFEIPANSLGQIKVSYDIYLSKNINGQWSAPIKLPGNVNSIMHERSPALSLDLKTLYYTSWPFGEVSKAKIMKAEYYDGRFINPQPLPAPINMNTQDICFLPSLDGKGYYFSSRRPGGYGEWDIFYVNFTDGKFQTPVNLGPKINSKKSEIHLSMIGETLFFCSNREGGFGRYDIYSSKLFKEDNTIKLIVRDKKTKKPVPAEMELSTKVKEDEESTVIYKIKKQTDSKGEATVTYDPKVKEMDVLIKEDGYLPLFKTIDIPAAKGKPQLLELAQIEKKASFEIHAIHFDFESSKIKQESFPYLNALANYLEENLSMRFEIVGHTDLHGSHEFNDKLSLERAEAVKKYLVGKGLSPNRFAVKGLGKTKPKIPKIGPEFDKINRRTEFILLGK